MNYFTENMYQRVNMRQKLGNLALEKVDSKILESMELKFPVELILKSTLSGIDPYPVYH